MPSTIMRWLMRPKRSSVRFAMCGWRSRCHNNSRYNDLYYYLRYLSNCGLAADLEVLFALGMTD